MSDPEINPPQPTFSMGFGFPLPGSTRPYVYIAVYRSSVVGFGRRSLDSHIVRVLEEMDWDEKRFLETGVALEMKADALRDLVKAAKATYYTEELMEADLHTMIQHHAQQAGLPPEAQVPATERAVAQV